MERSVSTMASFYVLALALFAVSASGYDFNIRQQYLPLQSQYQNPLYPAQLPLRSYNAGYSYPANYYLRESYYNPYYYQSRDIVPKEAYPVKGYSVQKEVVPSVYEQVVYSSAYPYQKDIQQKVLYQVPLYPTNQQEGVALKPNTYSSVYTYQTRELPQAIAGQVQQTIAGQVPQTIAGQVPVVGYQQQENDQVRQVSQGQVYPATYAYQTRELPQRVAYQVPEYIQQENVPLNQDYQGQIYRPIYNQVNDDVLKALYPGYQVKQQQQQVDQEYPYQNKEIIYSRGYQREQELPQEYVYPSQEGIQKVYLPPQNIQGYPEGSPYARYLSQIYAPRYPEGYQGYQLKDQEITKNIRLVKPSEHVKYESKHSKEEKKDSLRKDRDYEKNAIDFDQF